MEEPLSASDTGPAPVANEMDHGDRSPPPPAEAAKGDGDKARGGELSTHPNDNEIVRRNPLSRGGRPCAIVAATCLSCGIGGFNCSSGGEEPLCYVRCCRIDCTEDTCHGCVPLLNAVTCFYCCVPVWSARVHKILHVDFFKMDFFK